MKFFLAFRYFRAKIRNFRRSNSIRIRQKTPVRIAAGRLDFFATTEIETLQSTSFLKFFERNLLILRRKALQSFSSLLLVKENCVSRIILSIKKKKGVGTLYPNFCRGKSRLEQLKIPFVRLRVEFLSSNLKNFRKRQFFRKFWSPFSGGFVTNGLLWGLGLPQQPKNKRQDWWADIPSNFCPGKSGLRTKKKTAC